MFSNGSLFCNRKFMKSGILIGVFSVLFFSPMTIAITAVCGDGIAEGPEQCDDGNTISGDGCSSTCLIEPTCGNRVVEPGEQCDFGTANNLGGARGCTSNCTVIVGPLCGNGVIDAGEDCDVATDLNSCNPDCTIARCRDLKMSPGEQCDSPGDTINCNSNCKFSNCQDAYLNTKSGEECDVGMVTGSCNWNCRISRCGDSIINTLSGEQCDPPGNMTDGNTCTPTCKIILATTIPGGGTTAPSDPLVSTGAIVGIVVGVVSLIALIPLAYKGFRWGQKKGYWLPIKPAPLKANPAFNAGSSTTPTAPAQGAAVQMAQPKPSTTTSTVVAPPKKPLPVPVNTPPNSSPLGTI